MPRAAQSGNVTAAATIGVATGVANGDRCLYLGIGQLAGRQCNVLSVRRVFAIIRFDSGTALVALARDLHPVPRRPPPMF